MRSRSRRIAAVAILAGALATGPAVADRAIRGTSGNDTINAGDGRDRVRALAGNDTVFGGSGRDRIWAGLGRDEVFGGTGRDRLFIHNVGDVSSLGDDSGDEADGGPGRDRILARDGEEDEVDCGTGRDRAEVDQFDEVDNCERTRRRSVTAAGLQRRKAAACRGDNNACVRDRDRDDDDDDDDEDDDDDDDGNSGPG
jgi:RTX calcium-binding nonapeptide repeat (4 copies)